MNNLYEIAKFENRNKNLVYDCVIAAIEKAALEKGLTRRQIAKIIGKDQGAVSRMLSGPSNWTLNSVSNLLFAIGAEMKYTVVFIEDRQKSNVHHQFSGNAPAGNNPPATGSAPAFRIQLEAVAL